MDRILNGNYLARIPQLVDTINTGLLSLVVIVWSIGVIVFILAIVRTKKRSGRTIDTTGD